MNCLVKEWYIRKGNPDASHCPKCKYVTGRSGGKITFDSICPNFAVGDPVVVVTMTEEIPLSKLGEFLCCNFSEEPTLAAPYECIVQQELAKLVGYDASVAEGMKLRAGGIASTCGEVCNVEIMLTQEWAEKKLKGVKSSE